MDHKLITHIVWLMSLLVVLALPPPARAQERVRVGLSSVSATNGSVWVAEEKGLFKKYGIDAEVIVIGGGGSRVVGSLIAGELQFSVGGGEGSLRAQMKGADVVIAASTFTQGVQRMLARPEIKNHQDLKGKRIGITRFGSAAHLALQLMLKKWRMTVDDVKILQVGSSPAMMASLDKGGIDAAVLTMPSFFLAEEKGFRVIGDPVDMEIFYLQNTLETSRSFIRKNRDQALRFMKGYVEGIAYFKKHKAESIAVLRKKLRIQSEQERDSRYLELSYNLLASKLYREVPYPSIQAVQTVLDFIGPEDPKHKALDAKAFVEDSLVRELDENGFIKSLYGK